MYCDSALCLLGPVIRVVKSGIIGIRLFGILLLLVGGPMVGVVGSRIGRQCRCLGVMSLGIGKFDALLQKEHGASERLADLHFCCLLLLLSL